MHTVQVLTNLVEHHQTLTYFVIFLGLIFEGEMTLIFSGVLAHLGALDFWFALIFILAGGFTKTFLGYYIGGIFYKKFSNNRFFKYIEKRVAYIMPRFKQKPFWSIFLSKFIVGVNYFVIIFSGYQRVNFKKYLKAEFLATIIWAPLLLTLGYFFSYTALHVSREITRFSLVVILLVIGFLLLDKFAAFLFWLFESLENVNNNGNGNEKNNCSCDELNKLKNNENK
ncbi:MAG: DedA family protein [Candidatus Paceibacterota bacterium]|jgi:membrane-associated protein